MNQNIKMIVLDLDDTLLNDNLEISEYNKEVIANAQDRGIKLVLASGRATISMIKYAKELKLDKIGGFLISYNGALITEMSTGKILNRESLNSKNMDFLLQIAEDKKLHFQTYVDEKVIITKENQYTDYESEITGTHVVIVKDIKDAITLDPAKVILMEDPAIIKRVQEELRPIVEGKMTMNISKPCFLEFTNIKVDKNKSIDILCNMIGIDKKDVMAIGDSYNDLTMIKGCGLGIAMSNGHDEVKKHAYHITNCNNTDGVANAINRFALNI